MKVGDLVRVAPGQREPWSGQLGIIVEIDIFASRWYGGRAGFIRRTGLYDGRNAHRTMLISGAKKWFDLDELELVE